MSLYTTELRSLIAADYDLGLKNYPIFDEKYRGHLNQLITDHYYFYEIGAETPARFVHNLNTTMNENMPYFNKLYLSALLVTDPLKNRGLTRSLTGSENNETSMITTETNSNLETINTLHIESDTPAGLINAPNIQGNVYASAAQRTQDTDHNAQNRYQSAQGGNLGEHSQSEHFDGFDGVSQSQLVAEYRATLLNVDMLVIESLKTCFMGVY